jgi:hypothetical protein
VAFEQFYQSEVIDDVPNISPSLVGEVSCPLDKNIKIKIHVLYSSNLASKELVLCQGVFSFDDFLKQPNGILEVPLASEHTFGAKAYVELLPPLKPVLQDPHIQLCGPLNTNPAAPNPIAQNYVFYSEDDFSSPVVDVEEYCWEPRLAMKLSLLFLDNIRIKAFQSYQAWTERLLLEEMRQGHFQSVDRALSSGWHQLNVSVKAARINCIDVATSQRSKSSSASANLPYSTRIAGSLAAGVDSPQSIAHRQATPLPPPGTATPVQNTNIAFYSHFPIYVDGQPSVEPELTLGGLLSPAASYMASSPDKGGHNVGYGPNSMSSARASTISGERSSRSMSGSRTTSKGLYAPASMLEQLRATKKKVKIDETLPSTYVEMYYEDG